MTNHTLPNSETEVPFIELNQVSFYYDTAPDKPILKNVSLRIPKGKLVAIMGGSGSGKTTLLRLISGQVLAQQGIVSVEGQNMARMNERDLSAYRRKIGMLFQFGALFTDLTVFDNIAFPLREHTKLPDSMIRDLVLLKLEAVGLRGTEHMMPAALSGGMARRIALARAIALDPAILLYDEPFTGLDPISLSVIGSLIKTTNAALGTTSIMVTHDVQHSLNMVDYVYFMAHGEIVAEGTPQNIRQSESPWLRQFIDGKIDGSVEFAYPNACDLNAQLGLSI
ncbi:MAG: ABC transporter ATP-binding protein [Neisseriaceae bacterium]|nr:ABC transporter ATP-binding protein [Neisseriaceae bacterium]